MLIAVDKAQLEALYLRYAFAVERRCRRLLGDHEEAADALHEVFVKLAHKNAEIALESDWLKLLYTVATNTCLSRMRNRDRRDAAWRERARGETSEAWPLWELRDQLAAVLEQFDETTQQIAVYYYLDEMNQSEIGELVCLSRVSVNKRLADFRERALELLLEEESP